MKMTKIFQEFPSKKLERRRQNMTSLLQANIWVVPGIFYEVNIKRKGCKRHFLFRIISNEIPLIQIVVITGIKPF